MQKLIKHKWIIFVMVIVAVIMFDAIVHNTAIDDRGIVIGLGIDIEGDEVLVSAQILLQKNGGVNSGGSNYILLSGKDKTVNGACDQISDRLGMKLSLAHATMILVSRKVLAHDKIYLIKDFLTDDEVSDLTGLAMSDGAPRDILSAKIAYGEIASLQLQRMLKSQDRLLGLTDMSIKDFAVAYFTPNGACALPIVHKVKAEPSSDQTADQVKNVEQLVINRTAVVTKTGEIIELAQEANEGFSLVSAIVHSGSVNIIGDDNNPVSIIIVESKCTPKYSLDDLSVTYQLKIKCLRSSGRIDKSGSISYLLSDSEKQRFIEQINLRIKQAWTIAAENSADFWRVYEGFYRKYGKKWVGKIGGNYLSQLTLKTTVKVISR